MTTESEPSIAWHTTPPRHPMGPNFAFLPDRAGTFLDLDTVIAVAEGNPQEGSVLVLGVAGEKPFSIQVFAAPVMGLSPMEASHKLISEIAEMIIGEDEQPQT